MIINKKYKSLKSCENIHAYNFQDSRMYCKIFYKIGPLNSELDRCLSDRFLFSVKALHVN